jgi:endonuclease-8
VAEGDTIHRLARRFDDLMVGEEILEARAPSRRSPLHLGAGQLEGMRLSSARARGKHLLLSFDGELCLRSHLRMNGAWHLQPRGERWRKSPHRAWLVLATEKIEAVQFDGPELDLLPCRRLARHPRLVRLGPDLLAPGFTPEEGAASLRRADPGRELGDAILDQSLIAGVGNIFKSEGLHAAGLDPWRTLADLSHAELTAAVAETTRLMSAAVTSGRHPRAVYKATGRPCPRCGTAIRSGGQGDDNRTTYWCPGCQT